MGSSRPILALQTNEDAGECRRATLDIKYATPKKEAVFFDQRNRIALPVCTLGGEDIHVCQQQDGTSAAPRTRIEHYHRGRFPEREDVDIVVGETCSTKLRRQIPGQYRCLALANSGVE